MDRFLIAPEKCTYTISDPEKRAAVLALGFNPELNCWAITNSRQDKTIALIPDDDSSFENVQLLKAAPEMLEALIWIRQTIHQAYHEGDFNSCRKNTCSYLSEVITKTGGVY